MSRLLHKKSVSLGAIAYAVLSGASVGNTVIRVTVGAAGNRRYVTRTVKLTK